MPFVNKTDKDNKGKEVVYQQENLPDTPFGIAFGSAVGQVFDEGLSISGGMNREAWTDRMKTTRELIDAGEIDKEKYMVRLGHGYKFDYEALAKDDDRIRTNEDMSEERNEMLKRRREMSQDELSRASGAAQFAGSMTAYMLDPISVATMPIATATTAAKSLGTLGRIAHTARNAAAIEMTAEMAIQPFVFQHKMDIDSPYSQEEALTAIVSAGIGAGAIAGVTNGLAGYYKAIRAKADILPDSKDKEAALDYLKRQEETLKDNPHRAEGMGHEELVNADAKYIEEIAEQRRVSGAPTKKPEHYEEPETAIPRAETKGKEAEVLDKTGLRDDYDADMGRFRERQGAQGRKVHEMDQDFKGVKIKESVRVKQTGKVTKVDADAETVWRQTVKRRGVVERLEGCLNA
jgi:hypothetical protein